MSDMAVLSQRLETLHEDVGEVKTALKALSEAITKLALVEERQSQTSLALERAFIAIERIETRLAKLEQASVENRRFNIWLDRAIWSMAAAAAMFVAKKVGLL